MELESTELNSEIEWDVEPYPWRGFSLLDKVIALALPLLAIGVLILPFLDHSLLRRLTRLPALGGLIAWLVNSGGSWLVGIGLLLLSVGFLLYKRRRIANNEHQWVDAGCPQCQEHELVRVSRERSDRWYGLLSIPAYRYACRNCTWRGIRIARRHKHLVLAQEELILASSLALEAAGLSVKDTPPLADAATDAETAPMEMVDVEFDERNDSPSLDMESEAEPGMEPEAEPGVEPVASPTNHQAASDMPGDDELDWLWRRLSDDN